MRDTLAIGEVARLLHVVPSTVRRWVDRGLFPPPSMVTVGGRQRFAVEDVEAAIFWMNQRAAARRKGQAEPPRPWAESLQEA